MSDNIKQGKLSDFRPAEKNSNKHTAKGLKALDNSMSQDGYVAPMTATADGEILDGSARLERAFERFGDEAIVIHHDGKKPVVMVRDDIPNADDPLARRIHYRANIVQWQDFELDPEIVMADIEAGFDFEAIDVTLPELGEMLDGAVSEFMAGGGSWDDAFGKLPDSDRSPFQQMTFTLHDEQVEIVKDALKQAIQGADFSDSNNENSNGNALAHICERFVNGKS